MRRKSRLNFNTAFCGIMSALAVVIMFVSFVPALAYTMPAVAGLILYTIRVHISRKWAVLAYIATSALTIILVPEPEAQLLFVMLLGYYPLLREDLGRLPKLPRRGLKLALFNVVAVVFYRVTTYMLGVTDNLSGLEGFGEYAVYAFWLSANVTFIVYDNALGVLTKAYVKLLKPRIDRLNT